MISYECRAGRLIEVRIATPYDGEDTRALASHASRLFGKRTGTFVCAVDMRNLRVLSPEASDDTLENLRRVNRRIERTAVLLPTSATVALQIERLHREAGNPWRKAFYDARSLCAYLADVLHPDERVALDRFLG